MAGNLIRRVPGVTGGIQRDDIDLVIAIDQITQIQRVAHHRQRGRQHRGDARGEGSPGDPAGAIIGTGGPVDRVAAGAGLHRHVQGVAEAGEGGGRHRRAHADGAPGHCCRWCGGTGAADLAGFGIHPHHVQAVAAIHQLGAVPAVVGGAAAVDAVRAGDGVGGAPVGGTGAVRIPAGHRQRTAAVDEAEIEPVVEERQGRRGGGGKARVAVAEVRPVGPAVAAIAALAEPDRGVSGPNPLDRGIKGGAHGDHTGGCTGETAGDRQPWQRLRRGVEAGPYRCQQAEAGGGGQLVVGPPIEDAGGAAGTKVLIGLTGGGHTGDAEILIEEQS